LLFFLSLDSYTDSVWVQKSRQVQNTVFPRHILISLSKQNTCKTLWDIWRFKLVWLQEKAHKKLITFKSGKQKSSNRRNWYSWKEIEIPVNYYWTNWKKNQSLCKTSDTCWLSKIYQILVKKTKYHSKQSTQSVLHKSASLCRFCLSLKAERPCQKKNCKSYFRNQK
jgi:hypothetical protein